MRAILEIILIVLDLYIWLLIASAILSWLIAFNVVNTRNQFVAAVAEFLYRITEPVLRPIRNVMPNLGLGHSLDELLDIGESFSTTKKVRLFAGYAGWSGGQLEDEMRRKAWLTFPASLELVFDTPPEKLWTEVLTRKGGWRNKLRAQMPEDLSWN